MGFGKFLKTTIEDTVKATKGTVKGTFDFIKDPVRYTGDKLEDLARGTGKLFGLEEDDKNTALRDKYQAELAALKNRAFPGHESGYNKQADGSLQLNDGYGVQDRYGQSAFDQLQSSYSQPYAASQSTLNQYLSDYDQTQGSQEQGVRRGLQSQGRGLRDNISRNLSDQYKQGSALGRQGIRQGFSRATDEDSFNYNKEVDSGLAALPLKAIDASQARRLNSSRLLNELKSRQEYKVRGYSDALNRKIGADTAAATS